eukprot:395791_1
MTESDAIKWPDDWICLTSTYWNRKVNDFIDNVCLPDLDETIRISFYSSFNNKSRHEAIIFNCNGYHFFTLELFTTKSVKPEIHVISRYQGKIRKNKWKYIGCNECKLIDILNIAQEQGKIAKRFDYNLVSNNCQKFFQRLSDSFDIYSPAKK